METNSKVKIHCEQAISDCKETMFERAKFYKEELTANDKEDILELEPTGIVCNFDSEDLQNHNFDMGKMQLAKEILRILK